MHKRQSLIVHIGAGILFLEIFFCSLGNKALASIPQRPFVVIIDPGHGGSDNGALGTFGVVKYYEKNITLALAIRVKRLLENPKYWGTLGQKIKVVLTRNSDATVSLEDRTKIAQTQKPDLFLSIHTNAENSGTARGVETFFLNNTNGSERKIAEISKKKHNSDMDLLLSAVAADANVGPSKEAAEIIHQSVLQHMKVFNHTAVNRGVKQDLLYVLLDAHVPSVLFEGLFITNQDDLQLLSQPKGRETIADGLANGILRFLVRRE